MAELTVAEYEALPVAKSDKSVTLQGIRVHTHLPGSPATVVTSTGEFRLPKTLHDVALKAYEGMVRCNGNWAGADTGPLRSVLCDLSVDDAASTASDDGAAIQALTDALAQQAFGRLEESLAKTLAMRYRKEKSKILDGALNRLAEAKR